MGPEVPDEVDGAAVLQRRDAGGDVVRSDGDARRRRWPTCARDRVDERAAAALARRQRQAGEGGDVEGIVGVADERGLGGIFAAEARLVVGLQHEKAMPDGSLNAGFAGPVPRTRVIGM